MSSTFDAGDRATRTLIRLKQTIDLFVKSEPGAEDAVDMLVHIRDQMESELCFIGYMLNAGTAEPAPSPASDDEPEMPPTFGR